ncbi:MAG: OmpH family outer membrane protein [bacterium]
MLLTILVCAWTQGACGADLKIGFINSQRIIDESRAGRETTKKMETFKTENMEKLEGMNKEIEGLEQDLRKKEFALSPEKKREIEDSIRQKRLELKFFKEDKEKELKELFYQNLKNVENEVLSIVQRIGQEEGFDLVLGRDESGILYANPKIDITDKVIRIYDQQIQQ